MQKTQLSPEEAWTDFWEWIRQPEQAATWAAIERPKKQYLYKAEIDRVAGRLGYTRIKNILKDYAPDRYQAVEGFILKG